MIHGPQEQPIASEGIAFGYGASLEVLISVEIIESDEDLKQISLKDRRCYFKDERELKFFKVYTKSNCERECRSFVTFENCGCVLFYLIRNQTMKICDIAGTECAWQYENFNFEMTFLLDNSEVCKCLPTCDSITYNYDILSSRFREAFSDKYARPIRF